MTDQRLILRASMRHGERTLIAHTLGLSREGAFVQTEEVASVGDQVEIELSFPGLFAPVVRIGTVQEIKSRVGPAEPGGWRLQLAPLAGADGERFEALLDDATEQGNVAPDQPFRVLLVDDSKMTRDVFSLGAYKYFSGSSASVRVDLAENAESAWRLLSNERYQLAIVDYFLPDENGDQLISRLREDPRLAAIPVVAISIGGDSARAATFAAGADLFLEKPVGLRDLLFTLERLMRSAAR